jgi:hypothetical protein
MLSPSKLAETQSGWADQLAQISATPGVPEGARERLAQLANAVRDSAESLARTASAGVEQRRAAARSRVTAEAERNGPIRHQALKAAKLLRVATPSLSQGDLADRLVELFGSRLPKRDAVIKQIRRWEAAGSLALRKNNSPTTAAIP